MKYLKLLWINIWNWLTADDLVDPDQQTYQNDTSLYHDYLAQVTHHLNRNKDWTLAYLNGIDNDGDTINQIKHCILNGFFSDVSPENCAKRLFKIFPVITSDIKI